MAVRLQDLIEGLIELFHKYSGKEGDKYKLSNTEMKILLQEELTDYLGASRDPVAVGRLMDNLDKNKDGQVDFKEFLAFVSEVAVSSNEFFVDHQRS